MQDFGRDIGNAFNFKFGLAAGYGVKGSVFGMIGAGAEMKIGGGVKGNLNPFDGVVDDVFGQANIAANANIWRIGGEVYLVDVDLDSGATKQTIDTMGYKPPSFDTNLSASLTLQPFTGAASVDMKKIYEAFVDVVD